MTSPGTTPARLFCSDLDGTLLGNPESTLRFKAAWLGLPAHSRPVLVYNSGRLVGDIRGVVSAGLLPQPDFIIGGVGTQIFDCRENRDLGEFDATLAAGWDRRKVDAILRAEPGVKPQPESQQNPFKSSWYLDHATSERLVAIECALAAAGVSAHLVYSSSRDLDVVPGAADKGGALTWLCARLGIALESVIVAGDTANDSSMFRLPGVSGIIVENAHPELFKATVDIPAYTARLVMADGVIDGLRRFGVFDTTPGAAKISLSEGDLTPGERALFSGTRLGSLNEQEKELLRVAYAKAVEAVKKNITPMGFSACSLADNAFNGTDENYRSVWARDGAITLISTLDLDDPEIRACQRATLETLLAGVSPNGQIPANVRLDTRKPDYSGVGNICSIDSGLWVIIAVYNFVDKTQDLDFLRRHAARLQSAMNWLAAIDSNNDGLLEIPEAGDWTDLFGRSYHVLYDEVLWYRTNVCYGRILEFLGDFEKAGDYLRHSQHIRSKVLDSFWPTTKAPDASGPPPENRFASRQFELGDARYLLAEITPFSFSWRCDVYGNILAYLMNLLDADRARTAFKFMWGVGVNDPWPVQNLYPVVQSGDPDWKAYYTVNLLNLPHHYHNGGVWPFIAGMWVRFVHRVGYHEAACRELVRLAELNRQGREHEWEFNEWHHGRTGRPMGKAFQAWSAASFIKACHELEADPAHLAHD